MRFRLKEIRNFTILLVEYTIHYENVDGVLLARFYISLDMDSSYQHIIHVIVKS